MFEEYYENLLDDFKDFVANQLKEAGYKVVEKYYTYRYKRDVKQKMIFILKDGKAIHIKMMADTIPFPDPVYFSFDVTGAVTVTGSLGMNPSNIDELVKNIEMKLNDDEFPRNLKMMKDGFQILMHPDLKDLGFFEVKRYSDL